jgi:hypothetical protein
VAKQNEIIDEKLAENFIIIPKVVETNDLEILKRFE